MEKHIIVTGSSTVSWKDVITQTINETAKTIDYISMVKVLEQRARVNVHKLVEYFVDLDISFTVDRERE